MPIPNSHVIASTTPGFKTLELAEKIAANGNGQLTVVSALAFGEVQQKSREGGPLDPKHFESAYRVVRMPSGPVILVDGVCTSGGHLVAAH